jgi:hypothetical protein
MTARNYAENTKVSPSRSREEVEKILTRYGASSFASGQDRDQIMFAFVAKDRSVRIRVPMPRMDERRFTHTPTGLRRPEPASIEAHGQAVRQRWRSLALVVKAKLEAVESGIVSFDEEWAAFLVLPDGQTVGDHLLPKITEAYASGQVPALLPTYRRAIEA